MAKTLSGKVLSGTSILNKLHLCNKESGQNYIIVKNEDTKK